MATNTTNFNRANPKKAESEILADTNITDDNNANLAKNGNSNRDEIGANKMDRVCEVGKELSDKVLKKIESKDYLQSNLKRKSENVSYETLENNKENDEQRNVLFNSFVVITCLCAIILYFLSRILDKKTQKTSQNPPFENAHNPLRENTSEQKAGENESLADAILIRAGDK